MPTLQQIGKLFPTLRRVVASYDPATFYISLENISQADLFEIRKSPLSAKNIEHVKTLFHETRHYIDHVSSLWGEKAILSYLKSINVRLENDAKSFDQIILYKNQENQLFYADYYTEEYNVMPVDRMDRRWQWSITSGVKFDAHGFSDESKPLPLVHFRAFNGTPLIRIPLSIASLLETNSTAEEVTWHLAHLSTLSEIEQPFHLKFYANDTLLKLLYNQRLTLYNVAVHLTANILNISDFLLAFKISTSVASVALNVPSDLVRKMVIKTKSLKPGVSAAKRC